MIELAGIPCADNVPPATRRGANLIDHLIDLVDGTAIGSQPMAPLSSVDPPQVPIRIGPVIPNRDAMLI